MARPALTREAVLAAAMELADAEGLARLSMRRLGERLGVEAMSLYHHVASKGALLDQMTDAVFATIAVPPAGAAYAVGLRTRAISQRAALHRHPWALGLLESRATPGPQTLRHHDAVLGFLMDAGLSPRAAGHAFALLDSYVLGFVHQEQTLPIETETAPELAASVMEAHEGLELPHLGRFVAEVVMAGGYDFADEFEVGLDLVLDAAEVLRTS